MWRWNLLLIEQVSAQIEHPASLVVAGLLQTAQELFTESLFRMLTQLPERRRLSCGTMWPDRTHSSSLTFLCACSLGRELFMLHCFHRKQCHFKSQLLGKWDLLCVTVLWVRVQPTLTFMNFIRKKIVKTIRTHIQERWYTWKILLKEITISSYSRFF